MVEIEIKARINADETEKKLETLRAEFLGRRKQVDEYYKPEEIDTLTFRIRVTDEKTWFTMKGRSVHEDGGAWPEWETELEDPDNLRYVLISQRYNKDFEMTKDRSLWRLDGFEIYVDRIEGLGEFCEVELISDDVEGAKAKIKKFLVEKLEIPEREQFTHGYVSLFKAAKD